MNRSAKMFLFAVVAAAAIGMIGTESADAGCYGYSGWYATPVYHAHTYYAPTPIYRHAPAYGYGYGFGHGYGHGIGYGYGTG